MDDTVTLTSGRDVGSNRLPQGKRRGITRIIAASAVALVAGAGILAGALALFGGQAGATGPTVCTWTAAGASGGNAYWSTPGNWDCGSGTNNGPPVGGDAVVFPATVPSVSGASTPHLDESGGSSTSPLASITFEAGYTLEITSTSTTLYLDPSQYGVSGDVAISETASSAIASIGTPGSPAGAIFITGDATIESAGNLELNAALSGGASNDTLTFAGTSGGCAGSIELYAQSTYSGSTAVISGTLNNDTSNALPPGTSLNLGSACYELNNSQTLAGLTGTGDVNSNYENPVLEIDSSVSDTFGGQLTGTLSLDDSGNGTLTLSGSNDYTGGTTVATGTLVADSSAALGGSSGGSVSVASGATLQLGSTDSSVTLPNNLSLENSSTISTPSLSSYSSATQFVFGGTVTLDGTVNVDANYNTNLYLEGEVTGTGNIATTGPYTTWMANGSNNYSGGTTVDNTGTLVVEASGALGTGSVSDSDNAPIILDGSNISLSNDFTVSGGSFSGGPDGVISDGFSGFSPSVTAGADTLSGTIDLVGNTDLFAASGGTLSVTGKVYGGYGLSTSGNLVLSGTNDYTGSTTVSSGTLEVTGSIASSSGVTVEGGATLDGTGTVPAVTTSGCGSTSPCTIYPGDAPGTLTSTGSANLSAAGSTLEVALAGTSAGSYSELVADGADVSGTILDVTSVTPAAYGTVFDILHNTSGSPVTGEFSYEGSSVTQGEVLSIDGRKYQASYTGGTGNDFTLTDVTNPPPPAPAPVITSISPTSGPIAGGTTVTIDGSNLFGAAYVFFGNTQAVSFSIVSSTEIQATSPAESAGTVNVTVTTPGGTSATSSADQFTYQASTPPKPTVTSITPTSGSTAGGTSVTITGTNFTSGATVMFTVPACPGGDMAWISVEDTMLKDVAAMLPKNT